MSGILLIDAEQPFAGQMVEALQARGLAVQHLDEGKEALDYARANRPDLVVLCAELKQSRGWPVCKMLKKDDDLKTIPVIITSAEATTETFEQHRKLKARAEDYLHKPFDANTLLEHIGNLITLPAVGGATEEVDDPFEDFDLDDSPELMLDDNDLAELQIESAIDGEPAFGELPETTQNFNLGQAPNMPPVPMESIRTGSIVSGEALVEAVASPVGYEQSAAESYPQVATDAPGFAGAAPASQAAYPPPQEVLPAAMLGGAPMPEAGNPAMVAPAPAFDFSAAPDENHSVSAAGTAVSEYPTETPAPDPLSMPEDAFDADIEAELEKMDLDDAADLDADFDLEELEAPISSDFNLDDAEIDLAELPEGDAQMTGASEPASAPQVPMDVSQPFGEPVSAPMAAPEPSQPSSAAMPFAAETPASSRATQHMPAYAAPAADPYPAPSPADAFPSAPDAAAPQAMAFHAGVAQPVAEPEAVASPPVDLSPVAPVDAFSSVTSGAPVTNGVSTGTNDLQQINQLRHENTELKSQMVALQTRLQAAEVTVQSAQAQLTQRQESSSTSAREVLGLKEQLRAKDHELERMKDSVFEFEKKNVEVQEKLDNVRHELMGHAQVVNEKDVQLAALQTKVGALEAERNDLERAVNERLAQAEQDRDQLQKHIADLSAAHESILQQFEVMRADHNAKEAELAQIRQRLQEEAELRDKAKQATEMAMRLLSSQGADVDPAAMR